jgi:hypothetical protein
MHQNLAQGKWFELSLAQQLGNIGSEVGRARLNRSKNDARFWSAVARALDLFYLTLSDKRWSAWRKKEISRSVEIFCDAVLGGKQYGGDLESLDRYFTQFAFLAMSSCCRETSLRKGGRV